MGRVDATGAPTGVNGGQEGQHQRDDGNRPNVGGLRVAGHAADEVNVTRYVIGGNDEIIVPPNSQKTDYEVELCVVIKKDALYLKSPADAADYILGYTISQDVSERHWQVERSGQWVKGKSFPSFNPMGPWIVTGDELAANGLNPSNLQLSCTIDGEVRQNSNTNDLIFGINHCVWYITQFMELKAGDVINTGTPEGVGMGFKPEKFLKGGEKIVTTIEGIGTIHNSVVNYK